VTQKRFCKQVCKLLYFLFEKKKQKPYFYKFAKVAKQIVTRKIPQINPRLRFELKLKLERCAILRKSLALAGQRMLVR
jgi:hypothetical protein